jgi:hypothetical protein
MDDDDVTSPDPDDFEEFNKNEADDYKNEDDEFPETDLEDEDDSLEKD